MALLELFWKTGLSLISTFILAPVFTLYINRAVCKSRNAFKMIKDMKNFIYDTREAAKDREEMEEDNKDKDELTSESKGIKDLYNILLPIANGTLSSSRYHTFVEGDEVGHIAVEILAAMAFLFAFCSKIALPFFRNQVSFSTVFENKHHYISHYHMKMNRIPYPFSQPIVLGGHVFDSTNNFSRVQQRALNIFSLHRNLAEIEEVRARDLRGQSNENLEDENIPHRHRAFIYFSGAAIDGIIWANSI